MLSFTYIFILSFAPPEDIKLQVNDVVSSVSEAIYKVL